MGPAGCENILDYEKEEKILYFRPIWRCPVKAINCSIKIAAIKKHKIV